VDDQFEAKLVDLLTAIETLCHDFKESIAQKHGITNYNPEKIQWNKTEGPNGPYERYPAYQQEPEQTTDYTNLLNDLKNHDGKLTHHGLFYWLWEDKTTIGRQPEKKKGQRHA
jgi:hypothetical protein